MHYQTWSEEPLMQAKNDDDLSWGQMSTEVVRLGGDM